MSKCPKQQPNYLKIAETMSKCPKQQPNYLKIAEIMSKCPKQQPNYLKIAETSIVLIVFSGVQSVHRFRAQRAKKGHVNL